MAPEDQHAPSRAPKAPTRAPQRRLWFFAGLAAVCAGVGLGAVVGKQGHVSADVRSGSPGYKLTPSGQEVHWAKGAVTVYLDSSLQRLGQGADEAVMQAFGQWVQSDPRLPNLSFDTVQGATEPKQDGKSTVSYGAIKVPGHERDVAITITYSNDKTGEILEADMILNATYPMAALVAKAQTQVQAGSEREDGKEGAGHDANSGEGALGSNSSKKSTSTGESENCQDRYDTQNVATHEAGHFFGLGEDMVERKATMFLGIDECETHKRVLSATDTQAITTLYSQNAEATPAAAGPRACSFGVSASPEPLWLGGALLGLSLLRRRRPR